MLFSVGELNENKNHQIIIRALAKLNNKNVHYAIAGVGDKKEYLISLAKELGVSEQLHLLGYRKDVPELNHVSDLFCFPSHREGLGLAAIEAMACGLPLITSNIHGINDYSENDTTGYKCSPDDVEEFVISFRKLIENPNLVEKIRSYNKTYVKKYDVAKIIDRINEIYRKK